MSMQPLNHLRIAEPEPIEDALDISTAFRLLDTYIKKFYQYKDQIPFSEKPEITYTSYIHFLSILGFLIYSNFISNSKAPFYINLFAIFVLIFSSTNIYFNIILFRATRKRIKNLKNKTGEYFSKLIPLSLDIVNFQNIVNKSHELMNSKDVTSWQKVDLGVQLRNAEEILVEARKILNKYDPSLLSK